MSSKKQVSNQQVKQKYCTISCSKRVWKISKNKDDLPRKANARSMPPKKFSFVTRRVHLALPGDLGLDEKLLAVGGFAVTTVMDLQKHAQTTVCCSWMP